jgi:aspartate/methionine/tyrosine aminotransferase
MTRNGSVRYPIAAVRERVRRHSGPVLDFAVGGHREETPAAIRELIRAGADGSLLTRCSQDELERFVAAAVAMLRQTYHVEVSPAAVLPVPGGRTAMSFLASTLIRQGDEVAVVEPAYPAFTRVASELRARVHSVPLEPDDGFVPATGALTDDQVRSVAFAALNFPNNPTGAMLTREVLTGFIDRFEPGTIVFNDATYGPLTFDRPPWSLLAEAAGHQDRLRLLELHSVAKLYATGPLSVAFLVGDEGILDELRTFSEFAWSDQSSLQVLVGCSCLEDGQRFEIMRNVFRDRMARLESTLRSVGFVPFPSASGMYVVCRVPSAIGGHRVTSAEEAAETLLADYGVAVVPWQVEPHSYLRFSAQYLVEDLEALASLGTIAD